MRRYVVAYITRRGRADWPHAMTIEAENAKDARARFDTWYWTGVNPVDRKPHPFHITVKRFDGLICCPLCGSMMDELNDPDTAYVCQNVLRCGLKVKRKPS